MNRATFFQLNFPVFETNLIKIQQPTNKHKTIQSKRNSGNYFELQFNVLTLILSQIFSFETQRFKWFIFKIPSMTYPYIQYNLRSRNEEGGPSKLIQKGLKSNRYQEHYVSHLPLLNQKRVHLQLYFRINTFIRAIQLHHSGISP